ncbi:AAA family ATPase [Steroidobacter sp. S1-65]|uniref:AAA family ATPase n=1 Tax=Steroidobacter gossypii TaxID=2805490 RepID=A0ABS1X4E3_9GAMM|nr:helix-turn-helix transcriptional regulator [Steroidobacter gossypii]MBM0108093.1 AAA family ATPase [Steroidobacter gossypii]
MKLLEREELLTSLQVLLRNAAAGQGALLFLEGEAGIGKTSLLQTFAEAQRAHHPVYWGACDALQTPRPLGPLFDIAAQIQGELQAALANSRERLHIFSTFLHELARPPTLIVLEDLHWADEATLDFLRYVGRRIGRTHSLLIVSFRSDEVGPAHPLRLVLGDLATSGAKRASLAPLSLTAVRELIGAGDIDPEELLRRSGGNPFFVTEVIATGGARMPATVRDAVLARAARLRPSARAVLDAAAVAGPRIEPWLLEEMTAAESGWIDECLATGVLCAQNGVFTFRHELAREAVLEALTPTQAMSLHRMALQALQSHSATAHDLARLAHHAEGAASDDDVLKLAPAAAREAAAKGAHRQAAQQFARALRFAPSSSALRAMLLDDYASECQLSGMVSEAIQARQNAAKLWHELGDRDKQAMSLARLAHALVVSGKNAEGEATMREAVALVPNDTAAAAAVVRRWAAHLRMLDRDVDQAIQEGELAMAAAERRGDQESLVHCLNTIGSSLIVSGRVEEGCERLERSREVAEQMRSDSWIANAYVNLGSACGEVYRFDLADNYLRRGIEFCNERDIDFSRLYQLSWQALVWMYRGRWTEASGVAHVVLADSRSPVIARITALVALGRVRARRGDPAVWEALHEAQGLAGNTGTLQRVALMQAARAEAAWFEGRPAEAASEAAAGLELALRKRHRWFASELLFWCWQGDGSLPGGIPEFCANQPFAMEISGRWQEAAAAWRELRCPFEAARAMTEGDECSQREALAVFESFSARPMIERVRYKLRSSGVRGLQRGPRESTQNNLAGLTTREVEVLGLLAQGLRNKEIGQRLHRSSRTVDHHLAAIFTKLDVSTRAEAVSAAYRLGIISAKTP